MDERVKLLKYGGVIPAQPWEDGIDLSEIKPIDTYEEQCERIGSLREDLKTSGATIGAALASIMAKLADALNALTAKFAEVTMAISSYSSLSYANPKVIHLALHAKKLRTRKKNLHRMQKELARVRRK